MASARPEILCPSQRIVEQVRAGDEDALFRHLHQHAPPVAHDRTEIAGDAGLDDGVVDVGDEAERGGAAGGKDMAVDAVLSLAIGPVEADRFPFGKVGIGPVALQPYVEMDEAFLVGEALVPPALAAGRGDFQFDRQAFDLVAGELAHHRAHGAPLARFHETAFARAQGAGGDEQPLFVAVAEIGLDADGRGGQERHGPQR